MTKLNKANIGYNKFCGPAVLSILTGKMTDECAGVISSITGSKSVTGVRFNDMAAAAFRLGFKFESIDDATDMSMYRSLTTLASKESAIYMITLPDHYVTVEVASDKKLYFCDNHTKEPIHASASARLGQRVVAVHRCVQLKPIEKSKIEEPNLISTGRSFKTSIKGELVQLEYYEDFRYQNPKHDKSHLLATMSIYKKDLIHIINILNKVRQL